MASRMAEPLQHLQIIRVFRLKYNKAPFTAMAKGALLYTCRPFTCEARYAQSWLAAHREKLSPGGA